MCVKTAAVPSRSVPNDETETVLGELRLVGTDGGESTSSATETREPGARGECSGVATTKYCFVKSFQRAWKREEEGNFALLRLASNPLLGESARWPVLSRQ